MSTSETPAELEAYIGERLRALRPLKNLDQKTPAERAGISRSALKSLKSGSGSRLKALVSELRVLGREGRLNTVAPVATINPMHLTHAATPRQRATVRRRSRNPE